MQAIYAEIHAKRVLLDDIAIQLAANNDYVNHEYRGFLIDALDEAESDDDVRYEKKTEELDILSDRIKKHNPELSLNQSLLLDIRKRIAEIYFHIDKSRRQERRRIEWQQHGAPSHIRDEFKKYIKNSQTNPFDEVDSKAGNNI